jgi:hypothetical protein
MEPIEPEDAPYRLDDVKPVEFGRDPPFREPFGP